MKNIRSLLNQYNNIKIMNYNDYDSSVDMNDCIFLFPNSLTKDELLNKVSSGQMSCLINCNGSNFKSELLTAIKIKAHPKEFIYEPTSFLFNKEYKEKTLVFNQSTNKTHLFKIIEEFLDETNSRLVKDNSRILFEELFMNSVFDAPKEANSRRIEIPQQDAEMTIAFDNSKVVISCLDRYGLLNTRKFIQRINKIITQGTDELINFDPKKGGAGIGSSLIYRYSSTLCIVVDQNQASRVTVTIPLKMSFKKFESLKKNLQIIEINSWEESYGKQRKA